jgi:hypothetical protein
MAPLGRAAGVHELSALLLLARFLDISRLLDRPRFLDRAGLLDRFGLLYVSLRFGLGDPLPGYAQRKRAGHKRQKRQSDKDLATNKTPVPHHPPFALTDTRILHEPETAGLLSSR